VTMVVEIAAGMAFGSMALLADGLHMASHATALGIAVFAYAHTRRFAADPRYSFGTGKVNSRVCPTFYTWRFDSSNAAHGAGCHPCHPRCQVPCLF
jgi:hypothetical protein